MSAEVEIRGKPGVKKGTKKQGDPRRKHRGIFKRCDCKKWEGCPHSWYICYMSPAGFRNENTGQSNLEVAKKALEARKTSISSRRFGVEDMTEQEKLTVADAMTEYLEWRERRRRDDQFACHAKRMLARFGDQPVYWVQRKDVRKWIDDEIAPEYAHNTVSHIVNTGRALYSWLMRDDRVESNPFSGHEWKAEKTGIYIKPTVSEAEFQVIINMMENHPGARQAVTLAYYTGLRPSEAYRINPADFNHRDLELRVKVEKTVAGVRFVAIPRALSSWAVVQSQNWIEPNKITVQHAINCIRREHPALTGLCMASFRKNYAAIMEAAGASHEAINAHQGRRGSVLVNHYLKDPRRAVALMRPFIIQVFGDAGLQIHYSPIIHNG